MLSEIYKKFFLKYFLKDPIVKEKSIWFQLSEKDKINKLFFTYLLLAWLSIILVWFTVDIWSNLIKIVMLWIVVITNIIGWSYILWFFNRNNGIPRFRGYFYYSILMFFIPLFFIIITPEHLWKWIAYYHFAVFFTVIYFQLLPDVIYGILNFKFIYLVCKSSIFLIKKTIFLKIDYDDFQKEINKIKIPWNLRSRIIQNELKKKKEQFKIISIIILSYTLINLTTGINLYSIYNLYIVTSLNKVNTFIKWLETAHLGFFALTSIGYISLVIWICLLTAFIIIHAFSLYIKIEFLKNLLKVKKQKH